MKVELLIIQTLSFRLLQKSLSTAFVVSVTVHAVA